MATIRAFCPICPNPLHAGELVFTKPQSESVADENEGSSGLRPLKTLLESVARQRPETPEGQKDAYNTIHGTLTDLLAGDHLSQENSPGIYVYELVKQGRKQTGVWALTGLGDYCSGKIKVHEQTLADSVRRLRNYRENTGLEGSPVLLTYRPDAMVNWLIAEAKRSQPKMVFGNSQGLHRIWKVADQEVQALFVQAFERVEKVFVADGHHRLASAHQLAIAQGNEGIDVYDSISSLYISTDELRIEPYDRVVIPDTALDTADLIRSISARFHLLESTGNRPVRPEGPCRVGMCLDKQWYHLLLKSELCGDTASLDIEILQKYLLEPVFGITDPRYDSKLRYAGGEKALEEIGAVFQAHPEAIAFTLCPLSVEQLVSAAEEGRVLPPKATWIVPKMPYGLLIHRHGKKPT